MVISILFFFFFNHLILSDENICVRVSIVGLWAFLGGDDPALPCSALPCPALPCPDLQHSKEACTHCAKVVGQECSGVYQQS